MAGVGELIQRYVNNRYNLLLVLLITLFVLISLVPEFILHHAKTELVDGLAPVQDLVSSQWRRISTQRPPLQDNSKAEAELKSYHQSLQHVQELQRKIATLTQTIQDLPPVSIEPIHIPQDGETGADQHVAKLVAKQEQLNHLLKQAKEYQLLHISQSVELQHNLTLLTEKQTTDLVQITSSLERLREKITSYQHLLNTTSDQQGSFQHLLQSSQHITDYLRNLMRKVKVSMEHDEKLCKDRIGLLKRHQIKFQKEEFEQLIRATVNDRLQDYANETHPGHSSRVSDTGSSSSSASSGATCVPHPAKKPEKPDYALLSAGAEVVHTLTSATYIPRELQLKNQLQKLAVGLGVEGMLSMEYLSDFESSHTWTEAVGLFYGVGSVQDVLRPDLRVGNCWPMNGSAGNFTVKLRDPLFLESISIDHIGKNEVQNWRTAPRDFKIHASYSLQKSWSELLTDTFEPNRTTTSRNYLIPPSEENFGPVQFIRFEVLSNHGHPDYTCIYRFRVHGELI